MHSHQQLFVYGTLRSDFHHPAHSTYISAYFDFTGPARVKGALYDLGEYPGAIASGDGFITGELYRIKDDHDFDWAIAQLDDYEGLNETPPLYRRDKVQVHILDQTTTAWIYWYQQPIKEAILVASGDVLQYTQEKMNRNL
jgi:gamma-glutamylcyclotransferase (GGCT)/AIG2-like uncharacterized protein YtfP